MLFFGKFLLTYQEKRGKEKKGNGQKRRKIVKRNVENWKWKGSKLWKQVEYLFIILFYFILFFLTFFTFWNHWNLLGVYQYVNFYREKARRWEKIGKSDFAPLEKYSSYDTVFHTLTRHETYISPVKKGEKVTKGEISLISYTFVNLFRDEKVKMEEFL